ncbi:hypothetical protein AB0I53_44060 [Saccharopolyspora sp. NPDC050389]|uniref:hypothetical protein n=1 Tax=Saccharopolyspora sp. NPDC050389 TaxID=3155516 RepID=UPI0033C1944A
MSWVSDGEPDSAWENRLREVTAGSFADHIASRVRQKRSEGTGFYGAITPRITDIRVEGDRATVVDCQDTSHAGQSDLATGTPRTVGIERNATRATMVQEADGMWRVSQVEFPEGEC